MPLPEAGADGRRPASPRPGASARHVVSRLMTANRTTMTIAVLSQKGGTGKTTAVRTLADAFRRAGVKTLAVDLDPQGNLSDYFDLPPDVEPTIADVLSGRATAGEAIHDDLIPANLSLAEAELMLGGEDGPRADAAPRPGRGTGLLRADPDRLPALARTADGQRAGRGRPRAGDGRGPVFRAAGSRAGDGGDRARAGAASTPSCGCSACC